MVCMLTYHMEKVKIWTKVSPGSNANTIRNNDLILLLTSRQFLGKGETHFSEFYLSHMMQKQ